MTVFDQQSPVVVLPPSQHFTMDHSRPSFTSPFGNGTNSFSSGLANLTPTSSLPPSAAGRKRSRDEAAANLEEDYFPPQPPKEPENEEEWEYGEGMTLIKPNKGYTMDASSQTGTWQEEKEKAEEDAALAALAAQQDRPILRATKSLRLDMTATPPIAEEATTNGVVSAPSPERSAYVEPAVDDFTRHLGIGWSAISADPDIQAAARGWTKFIENHFPVTNARIRLQSRGLASYLVEADEGFFLFQEDLKKGQLVSTILEKTLQNLSSPVPVFDGETVMEAIDSPRAAVDAPAAEAVLNGASTNGQPVLINGANGFANGLSQSSTNCFTEASATPTPAPSQTMEVEMDMS